MTLKKTYTRVTMEPLPPRLVDTTFTVSVEEVRWRHLPIHHILAGDTSPYILYSLYGTRTPGTWLDASHRCL